MKCAYQLWRFDHLGSYLTTTICTALIKDILSRKPNARVLEIGCGVDTRWRTLFSPPAKYTGMDIVKREGVDVVASAENMPFENDSYDVLFSNAVIEHIPDVTRAIAEMHRVLRPGGSLIIGAPNVWPIHDEPHDYRRWTPYGLMWEFRMFNNLSVRQVGGRFANTIMIVNAYLRRWQECSSALRFALAPFVTVNNLMGRLFPGDNRRKPTLAVFYIMTATK